MDQGIRKVSRCLNLKAQDVTSKNDSPGATERKKTASMRKDLKECPLMMLKNFWKNFLHNGKKETIESICLTHVGHISRKSPQDLFFLLRQPPRDISMPETSGIIQMKSVQKKKIGKGLRARAGRECYMGRLSHSTENPTKRYQTRIESDD